MEVSFIFQSRKLADNRSNLQVQISDGRGSQKQISTGIKLHKGYWDRKHSRLKAAHDQFEALNLQISEWEERMYNAKRLYEAKRINFLGAIDTIKGVIEGGSVDAFLNSYIKEVDTDVTYQSKVNHLNGFKKYTKIKGELKFEDVDNMLVAKMYKEFKRLIREGMISERTYNSYLGTTLGLIEGARINGLTNYVPKIERKYLKIAIPFKKNERNSPEQILRAIGSIDTIEKWQSCGLWLLMFSLRGLYPADIIRIGEGRIRGDKDPEKNLARSLRNWDKKELWLDLPRSKSGEPMFIRIFPEVLYLIERLKYSFIYTHAGHQIGGVDIVPDLTDRIAIFAYDSQENSNAHKQLWKTRQNKFAKMNIPEVQFKRARKSFENYTNELTDGNTTIIKKLQGRRIDGVLDASYSNYKSAKWIEKLDKVHESVYKEFGADKLIGELVSKLDSLISENKCPKWVVKRSAVHKSENEYKVLVAVDSYKGKFTISDWVKIDKKYHKYFNDPSMEVNYWEDFEDYIEEISPKVTFADPRKYKDLVNKLKQDELKKTKVINLKDRTA